MSVKQSTKNPRSRHQKPVPKALTPEEEAKILADLAKAEEERKAEEQRVLLYGKALTKMSHRQLRGELRRAIKREYAGRPPVPQAGQNILLSTILLTVFDNTQTKENPFAKLSAYPR